MLPFSSNTVYSTVYFSSSTVQYIWTHTGRVLHDGNKVILLLVEHMNSPWKTTSTTPVIILKRYTTTPLHPPRGPIMKLPAELAYPDLFELFGTFLMSSVSIVTDKLYICIYSV